VLCNVAGWGRQSVENTPEPLTIAHEAELHSMIVSYYLGVGSLSSRRDPNKNAEVATGPLLQRMLEFGTAEPGTSLTVITAIAIKQIHVLEYSSSRVKAIGCGILYSKLVSYEGEYIQSLRPMPFMNVFVFVLEDEKWKLFTHYFFGDQDAASRDWAYVSEEEKLAIGNLEEYMDTYWPCGFY